MSKIQSEVYISERVCVVMFDSAIKWPIAHQVPLSMGFSRQEYWSGLPFPSSGDLATLGTEPTSLASPVLADGFFTTSATWEAPVHISGLQYSNKAVTITTASPINQRRSCVSTSSHCPFLSGPWQLLVNSLWMCLVWIFHRNGVTTLYQASFETVGKIYFTGLLSSRF